MTTTNGHGPRILLEIACGDLRDALAADQAGADRVELCSALELQGLTPSLGMVVETYDRTTLPIVAMVRPRAGDFVYAGSELEVMMRDTQLVLDAGAAGIVFGCLTTEGQVNATQCGRLVALAGG